MIVTEGAITDRPLPRTFAAIAARGFTGELIVTSAGREHRVAWRDGGVVGATSPHPADSAAKIAVTLGVLSSTQAGEVTRIIAANPGCDEIEVVARVARLASDMVGRLGRRLVATRAARLFAVDNGRFQLDDTPPLGAIPPVDARWILYSGVRAHYTIDRLHREVASMADAITVPADADLAAFGFGEGEADVLARLVGARMNLAPSPAGLDARIVEAIALTLLATGVATAVPGDPRVPTEPPRDRVATPTAPPPAARPSAPAISTRAPTAPGRPSATAIPTIRDRPASTPMPAGADRTPSGPIPTVPTGATGPVVARAPTPSGPIPVVGRAPTPTGPVTARTTTDAVVSPPPRTTTRPITTVPGRASTGSIPVMGRPAPRVRGADPARVAALIADRKAALDAGADHFAMLGIEPDAPVEAVRAAYFELARHLHPDRLAAAGVGDDKREAHRVFARINEAFGVLSDPDRRAEYARVLKAGGVAVVQAQAEAAASKVKQVMGGEEAFRQGEAALRRMALVDAVAHFKSAVELSPEEGEYHAMLGWALYVAAAIKADVLSSARGHLRKAMELRPNSALPHLLLGRIARMEGEATPAINHLRQALELAPRSSEAAAELRAAESMKQQASSRPGLFSRPKK